MQTCILVLKDQKSKNWEKERSRRPGCGPLPSPTGTFDLAFAGPPYSCCPFQLVHATSILCSLLFVMWFCTRRDSPAPRRPEGAKSTAARGSALKTTAPVPTTFTATIPKRIVPAPLIRFDPETRTRPSRQFSSVDDHHDLPACGQWCHSQYVLEDRRTMKCRTASHYAREQLKLCRYGPNFESCKLHGCNGPFMQEAYSRSPGS